MLVYDHDQFLCRGPDAFRVLDFVKIFIFLDNPSQESVKAHFCLVPLGLKIVVRFQCRKPGLQILGHRL